jgi:hypothetical protein
MHGVASPQKLYDAHIAMKATGRRAAPEKKPRTQRGNLVNMKVAIIRPGDREERKRRIEKLRRQYTPEVNARTEQLNSSLPMAGALP